MSTQYWKNKNRGICYLCRERAIREGHATCDACAKMQRERQAARVIKALEIGKCRKCFYRPVAAQSTRCHVCLERDKNLRHPVKRQEALQEQPLRSYQGRRRKTLPLFAEHSEELP